MSNKRGRVTEASDVSASASSDRPIATEEAVSVIPWPFSALNTFDSIQGSYNAYKPPDLAPIVASVSWFIALSHGNVNPEPPKSKWFVPPNDWQVVSFDKSREIDAIRQGTVQVHPNGLLCLINLVSAGFVNRITSGTERVYYPHYVVHDGLVSCPHAQFRLDVFTEKSPTWVSELIQWLHINLNPPMVRALPTIASAVVRAASKSTPGFSAVILKLLKITDTKLFIATVGTELENLGVHDNSFTPLLIAIRTPLLDKLTDFEKWDLIRDGRYRGTPSSLLSCMIDSLQVQPPVGLNVMSQYYLVDGNPIPVKSLRKCTEKDFIPCGPKIVPGSSILMILNKEDASVPVLPAEDTPLYSKHPKTNVLTCKGTPSSMNLTVIRGDVIAKAANPMPKVEIVVAPAVEQPGAVKPMTNFVV